MKLLHRRPTPDTAPFSMADVLPGSRYLVCDETDCAHNVRRHIPVGTGYRCTTCQTLKGDQ